MILFRRKSYYYVAPGISYFPNGETKINKGDMVLNADEVVFAYKKETLYEDIVNFQLICSELNTEDMKLTITYLPFSRMDRKNDLFFFTLKGFADIVNRQKNR